MPKLVYRCPECNIDATDAEWNQATAESTEGSIEEIQEAPSGNFFVCPSCGRESDDIVITRIHDGKIHVCVTLSFTMPIEADDSNEAICIAESLSLADVIKKIPDNPTIEIELE